MIFVQRVSSKIKHLWKKISGNPLFWNKMSANDVPDGDQSKRVHEDEEDAQKHKKLCTDGPHVDVLKTHTKKKKYAILLGYNGKNYRGMQINKDIETIELELHKTLYKSGMITETEFKEMHLTRFQRAARTDKGVSAARQVVSLKLSNHFNLQELNNSLPTDIRIFSIKRVTKYFDSKGNCDARTYSYLLPTQALSQEPMNTFLETDYRISPDTIKEVNEILKLYCGTHNFHNFTHKRLYGDPSCKRYIMSFTCGEPFVRGKEFVLLTVKGQSFMFHQIRKMVGLMIAIKRGLATPDFVNNAFLRDEWHLPVAPGEGLFLEKPHFDKYNKRYGNDGIHEPLTWDDVEEEVMKFRDENIISQIIEHELQNQGMAEWIEKYLPPIRKIEESHNNSNKEDKPEEKEAVVV